MSPFAWMVGQIQEAVAHQEPAGSVALPPGMRSVVACIKELGRPITSEDLARMAHIERHKASQRIHKAAKADIVRVVGSQPWQGRTRYLYDLSGEWRK